jgi:hypothetical protein
VQYDSGLAATSQTKPNIMLLWTNLLAVIFMKEEFLCPPALPICCWSHASIATSSSDSCSAAAAVAGLCVICYSLLLGQAATTAARWHAVHMEPAPAAVAPAAALMILRVDGLFAAAAEYAALLIPLVVMAPARRNET